MPTSSAPAGPAPSDEPHPRGPRKRYKLLLALVFLGLALCAVGASVVPGISPFRSGKVLWTGDAETGNLGQWASAVRVARNRIRAVRAPVRHGRYSYRFEVRQGDNPVPDFSDDDRAELGQANPGRGPLIREGMEQWYGFSVMFGRSFPKAAWQTIAQWKQVGPNPPPAELSASDDEIAFAMGGARKRLAGDGGELFETRLVRRVWNDFVMHVKWSPRASVGFVELWYDGKRVVRKTYTANMHRSSDGEVIPNHSRIGYYRDRAISQTGVVYIDGYKVGTSYDAVAP